MPLDPMTFQDEFQRQMLDWTLIETNGDKEGKNVNDATQPELDFPLAFSNAYKTYAEEGIIIGYDITALSEDARAAMEGTLATATSSSMSSNKILAQAIIDFWDTIQGDTGAQTLEHGGVAPSSVVNNATAMLAPMEAIIIASHTTGYDLDAWATFIENTQTIVQTIVWQVTEMFTCGPTLCPITIPEMVA